MLPRCMMPPAPAGFPASIPCPRGYETFMISIGDLCHSPEGHGYASVFLCDRCRRTFATHQTITAHCAVCRFDLCPDCTGVVRSLFVCHAGHPLYAVHDPQILIREGYVSGRYSCDQCRTCTPLPVMHCPMCRFDLCSACTGFRIHQPLPMPAPMPPSPYPGPQVHPPMPQPPQPQPTLFVIVFTVFGEKFLTVPM